MKRLRPFLALLLAVLWLPAVLHCAMEAAGVDPLATECCASDHEDAAGTPCRDDACATVEEAYFKETSQVIKVAAPDCCGCLLCLTPVVAEAPIVVSPLAPERIDLPDSLAVRWQFAVRAALPARAPSRNT